MDIMTCLWRQTSLFTTCHLSVLYMQLLYQKGMQMFTLKDFLLNLLILRTSSFWNQWTREIFLKNLFASHMRNHDVKAALATFLQYFKSWWRKGISIWSEVNLALSHSSHIILAMQLVRFTHYHGLTPG